MKKLFIGITLCFSGVALLNAQVITETVPGVTAGNVGTVEFKYGGVNVMYYTVRAMDGNVWLQQNLGSTQVAESRVDVKSFGDLFAWGRWDDGHHFRDNTKINLATAAGAPPVPNNPTILDGTNPFYFSNTTVLNWWWGQGVNNDTVEAASASEVTATNGCDPCKKLMGENWSMPTKDEWETVRTAEGITDANSAFSSNLYLPSANTRAVQTGALGSNNNTTRMWSKTAGAGGGAYALHFTTTVNSSNTTTNISRGNGLPIRCKKMGTTTSLLSTVVKPQQLFVSCNDDIIKFRTTKENEKISKLCIFSVSGRVLYEMETNSSANDEYQIPLSLEKGLYIATVVFSSKEKQSVKFVKN